MSADGGGPIATVQASAPRRLFAVAVLGALGAILLWAGLAAGEGDLAGRLLLVAMGGGAIALGVGLWHATARGLILTETELREGGEGGRVLARIEEVGGVSRGAFAFKPSNGFMLRLETPGPRAWAPGLWWRLGRRVGVGGVLRGAETRAVAEMITAMRAGGAD